jgi:GTPase Era involved in 16S rRNA processing
LLAEIDPTVYATRVAADRASLRDLQAQRARQQSVWQLAEVQKIRSHELLSLGAGSQEAADAADVILVVVDSTEFPGDEDRMVAKKALKSKKPVILVTNKADLKGALHNDEFRRLGIKDIIRTSAEHNSGVSELLDPKPSLIAFKIPAVASELLVFIIS